MSLLNHDNSNVIEMKYPRFFKSPVEVKWNITGQCLSNCQLCYREDYDAGTKADLSDIELINIAKDLIENEILRVIISGGEPFLRREVLYKIIPMLSEENIGLCIETNGLYLNNEDIELLEHHGVSLCIGISNTCKDTMPSTERTLEAIRKLKGRVPSIQVNYLLQSSNVNELEEVIDQLYSLSVVSSIEVLTPVVRGRALLVEMDQYRLCLEDYQKAMDIVAEKNVRYKDKMDCIFKDHSFVFHNMFKMDWNNHYAVIDNDGKVKANDWLPIYFGSVAEEKLSEIWEWGLNNCWNDSRLRLLLKDIKNINKLGGGIEKIRGQELDFHTL